MPSIRTSFCRNLHAKCYLNETQALITSMNLYEFSQMNNREMGVLVERDSDPELYQKIYEEVQRIIRASTEENKSQITATRPLEARTALRRQPEQQANTAPRPAAQPAMNTPLQIPAGTLEGHCIRCREIVPLNPKQPYCKACFTKWKRFDHGSYSREEKHCHQCGRNHTATLPKPLCQTCFAGSRNQHRS